MAIKLKVQTDNYKLKTATQDTAKFKASVGIPIYPDPYTGEYEVTPTEEEQTISANGLMMTDDVTVHAVSSTYVGSDIPQRASDDVTVSADTVTIPNGYYEEGTSKTVQSGSATTPTGGITANPTISVSSSGLITASVTKSESIIPIVNEGYVTTGQAGTVTFSGSATSQLSTQGASTISPTESEQTAVTSGKYTTGDIKVGAIPSSYVGSGVTRRDGDDLSASGATVSVPSGYYAESASKSVASGSASTPATSITANPSISVNSSGLITATASATKSVTPAVSEGYVSSGTAGTITVSGSNTSQLSTQAGTTITPTESEQTAVASGKYTTGAVKVGAISSTYVGTGVTRRDSDDLSASGATVTAPSGYYAESATKTIASGSATPAASISASSASKSIGNGSITLSKTVSNTPQVTAGYVSSGTAGNTSVSLTASVTTQGAQTIHPSTSDQTIGAATYTTGVQTFKGVTLENLSTGNIKDGVTVKVGDSTDDDCVASVTGTYTGGGGTPNLQTKTNIDPTTSSQTITYDTGYDGLDSVQINAMPAMTLPSLPHPTTPSGTKKATINYQVTADRYLNIPTGYNGTAQYYEIKGVPKGTVTAPSTITATGATSSVSIANQTITLTKAVSVTPSVTTVGYISSGTAGNASVSLTASDITFRESDSLIVNGKEVTAPVGYYPAHAYASVADGTEGTPVATKGSVSNHTISVTPSVTNTTGYITGSTKTGTAVTVSASELVSGSETKTANGTYDVTNLASLVVNVSGGTSKNTQVVQGTTRTTSSSMTAIGAELTVSKTGTYDIYWSAFRSNTSSSYTYATQLYIDGTAHGSENSTWSNHCQNNHLTNVSLTINQKLRVRGRESRGSTYYIYAPTLVIVEN